ncbi:hypothetical protein PI125_g10103 [Phytophthora idaei]|nr:hypothetical protein PI125_g10103 [Phytophthora idaei]KAG3165400.1 hypothetical protein PI126_g4664 [Phytophthora idaei]
MMIPVKAPLLILLLLFSVAIDPLELESLLPRVPDALSDWELLDDMVVSGSLLLYHRYELTELAESVVKKSYNKLISPRCTHEWLARTSLSAATIPALADEHELSPSIDPVDPTLRK